MFDNRPNAKFLPNPKELDGDIGIVILALPPKYNPDSVYGNLWDQRRNGTPLEILSSFDKVVTLVFEIKK
ncbi:MAG: hypothetical protein EOP45_20605 [Sphingobacteriaceae bacterium]|nr:MAG: hypothetical protein EOP45_20605 [Sphingobacteriaceae bacterium]